MPPAERSLRAASSALRDLRGFLVDLDGVVYSGGSVIPGASEFFSLLRRRGLPFLLITNNSTRTPAEFAARLAGMGIEVAPGELLTSAEATADYLVGLPVRPERVFLIGEAGLRAALASRGFTLVDDPSADCVVVGLDRAFDYRKLKTAFRAVRAGALFVGPNPDPSVPDDDGLIPGAGSLQAALRAATGVSPVIVGKPEPAMLQVGVERLALAPREVALIGDRLDTDVLGGRRAGLVTILVLTGVATPDDLARAAERPDYVFRDLFELAKALIGDT